MYRFLQQGSAEYLFLFAILLALAFLAGAFRNNMPFSGIAADYGAIGEVPRDFSGFRAQGATEYVVVLAVVIGVGLIAASLLGSAPSAAADMRGMQYEAYWESAFPISIMEADAKYTTTTHSSIYLKVKNNQHYPIRITALIGGSSVRGRVPNVYVLNTTSMSGLYYLGSGETGIFGYKAAGYWPNIPENRRLRIYVGDSANTGYYLYAAKKICTQAGKKGGTLEIPNFGFEYVTYIDNAQITKKQIGSKPLIIQCT
ncbi:MAG: hypothetical protein WC588_00180 [Candidatus Micrarchaeia archaeon]